MRRARSRAQWQAEGKRRAAAITAELRAEGYQVAEHLYTDLKQKVEMTCPNGHTITISWGSLKDGRRCKYCSWDRKKVSLETVRKLLAEEGYELLTKEIVTCLSKEKIQALCPNGHIWTFLWPQFKDVGNRCKECFLDKRRNTIEEVTSETEMHGYTLLSTEYGNCKEKLSFLCPVGHSFKMRWNDFQSGYRCSKCFGRQSKAELELIALYQHLNLLESDKSIIGPKELDLYFPDHQVAIEYCGLYWHSDDNERITSSYHRDKMDKCSAKDIRLLTIFEDEWKNHKDICISRINNALGISSNRIYARNTIAREVPKSEAKEFLNRTHLQGYGRCKIAYGLYHNNKLVSVMTWGSPARAHTAKGKRVLEMKRFASELDTIIVGGASKLLKLGMAFAKDNNYDSLKSYCDLRWGTGNLYKKLEFTKTHETRYTPHYTDGKQRFRNQVLATNKKKEKTTEAKKAEEKGLFKIYDCGHSTWEYEITRA